MRIIRVTNSSQADNTHSNVSFKMRPIGNQGRKAISELRWRLPSDRIEDLNRLLERSNDGIFIKGVAFTEKEEGVHDGAIHIMGPWDNRVMVLNGFQADDQQGVAMKIVQGLRQLNIPN